MTVAWNVALCSPPYRTFSYGTPEYLPENAWAAGQRVMVPVSGSIRMGVIVGRQDAELQVERKLKPLAWPLDQELLLSKDVLELVRHLAKRQMAPEGLVLSSVLPKALRAGAVQFALREGEVVRKIRLDRILRASSSELLMYGQAWLNGLLTPVIADRADKRNATYVLLRDPPWDLRPGAKRQLAVLEYLFTHGSASRKRIAQAWQMDAAASESRNPERVLADLVRKGLIQESPGFDVPEAILPAQPQPRECAGTSTIEHAFTTEQTAAFTALQADLEQSVRHGNGLVRLVHGITGSGKTLLYLRLARAALAMGKSVLLLAPEVALSAQLWTEVSRNFPEVPKHWYHGYFNPGLKLAIFRSVRQQATPRIVVGTRSALFLPFADLGLIILDEEHDASYKQDEGFMYQAKEVAYFRINQHGGLMLLGSATPDVKTFYAADQGEIARVTLRKRISRCRLPEIGLVDMRRESRSDPLSVICRSELEGVLERKEQAMFLLNRRGFAPLVSCLDCGTAPKCPRCEVGLTYHKGWERLLCHYCGYTHLFPCKCAQCGGTRFLPMGEGTEGLEEYLGNMVASSRAIVRLDRDSTRRKGRMESILETFAQGRAQIMVGTQMLSKGHHFPNVTLVVAVDGDVGLNLPDYRAAEKTFQLLVQLAGRAGRGERPGRVLIQTRNPEHPCWEHIRTGNYEAFFAQELERRRKFAYPPFVKLAMIRLSYPREWERGADVITKAGEHLLREGSRLGLRVLGPAPAPLSLLNGRKRFQCLVKAMSWLELRDVYSSLQSVLPRSSPFRSSLDLDPVNML
ncbi:primosomal protein N' [Desulfonatronum parangueonense]